MVTSGWITSGMIRNEFIEVVNVIPINDWVNHTEDRSCICRPQIEIHDGRMLIIHDAIDDRK